MHIHSDFNTAANSFAFHLNRHATHPLTHQGKTPSTNGSKDSREPQKSLSKSSVTTPGELPKSSDRVKGEQRNTKSKKATSFDSLQLTPQERKVVQQLRNQDREVRAHEQAHLAAAGAYTRGGASFQYQTGPDGRRYAVGGEVSIDTSPIRNDPEATVRKAQVIQRAANAPAKPSSQDRRVASQAAAMEAAARQEAAKERSEETKDKPKASEIDKNVEAQPEEDRTDRSSTSGKATDQGRQAEPKYSVSYVPNATIHESGANIADIGNLLDLLA